MSATSEKIRILHVDDEPDFGAMAAEFLERQDSRFEVETATSGSEALEKLPETDIHCIVSDFDMPGQDGIQFLDTVRDDYPDLPFILFTGKGSEEVASEAISRGVTDYLQKEMGTSQYEVLANRIVNAVEQHRARQMAVETEQRLQTIAENTQDILWKFDDDWNELLFINSAYEEIWGRSTDELRERPQSFLEGIHPADRDFVEEAMAALSGGESVDIEYRVNAEEDFGRWVWVRGEPVFDDAGEVVKVVGFARDITDRKERERTLQEQRADLRVYERAIESSSDLLAGTDTEGNLLFANQRYREFHGLAAEDEPEVTLSELLGDAWESAVKPRLERALAGENVEYQMVRPGPDGEPRTLDIRYYPLRSEDGEIFGAVAAMRDITDKNAQ